MAIPEHYSWPPHFKVAKIIAACLPSLEYEEVGDSKEKRFIFRKEGISILELNKTGWIYGFDAKNGNWRNFQEGSYESIAEYVLEPLVDLKIRVMKPPSRYDFENPPEVNQFLRKRKLKRF